MPASIEPRGYQWEAINAFRDEVSKGNRRAIIKLPTGTGKTFTAALVSKFMGVRTLWLAHRTELIEQPQKAFAACWPDAKTGVVKAEQNDYGAVDVVFASVQSMVRRMGAQNGGIFGLIVVDEAHHTPAATYKRIIEYYSEKSKEAGKPPPAILGLTATPTRADGVSLEGCYDVIAYDMSTADAIRDGFLCNVVVRRIVLPDLDLSRVKVTKRGDFNERQLAEELMKAGVAEATSDIVTKQAACRKSLVFTVSVDQAIRTSELLKEAGIKADWVAGITPKDERKKKLAALESGDIMCMCSAMILTEGFDCPSLNAIIIARPTKSQSLFIQMAGRGLRIYPDKADCLVVDIVGGYECHGLQSASDLLGPKKNPKASDGGDGGIRGDKYFCTGTCEDRTLTTEEIDWFNPPPAGPGFCRVCNGFVQQTRCNETELRLLETLLEASRRGIDPKDVEHVGDTPLYHEISILDALEGRFTLKEALEGNLEAKRKIWERKHHEEQAEKRKLLEAKLSQASPCDHFSIVDADKVFGNSDPWLTVKRGGVYAMSAPKGMNANIVILRHKKDTWRLELSRRDGTHEVLAQGSLIDVRLAANNFTRNHPQGYAWGWDPYRLATTSQLEALKRWRVVVEPGSRLTMEEAGEAITRAAVRAKYGKKYYQEA